MGTEFITALVAQTDELARRLLEWNERFLETKLALQERSIEVRVEQLSDVLADQKSATRLRANKQWVKKSEQIRLWLDWLGGRISHTADNGLFLIAVAALGGSLGWVLCLNAQPFIACASTSSLCYQLKFWGEKTTVADIAKNQCTQTREGIVCMLPQQKHKKSTKTK